MEDMFLREAERANRPRPVYGNERTCSNCSLHDACWVRTRVNGTPINFGFRAGWDEERYRSHLKGIIGQVCGNFSPSDPDRIRHFLRADERRRRELRTDPNGWDLEENQ